MHAYVVSNSCFMQNYCNSQFLRKNNRKYRIFSVYSGYFPSKNADPDLARGTLHVEHGYVVMKGNWSKNSSIAALPGLIEALLEPDCGAFETGLQRF